jgi:glucosamine-6-phosphate deaminase
LRCLNNLKVPKLFEENKMDQKDNHVFSKVEKFALKHSRFTDIYPLHEKIRTIIVDNFPALGKLTALRFLEWIQQNPDGVISLPTGKTPEHFIKWTKLFLRNWNFPEIQKELEEAGLDIHNKPDMRGLHFVQIDEFYPINSHQHNSFYYYVNKYYLQQFKLDPTKAHLINCSIIGLEEGENIDDIWPESEVDLSLRYRSATSELEKKQKLVLSRIDQWCQQYEEKIRALGGIGFFLGGIGPDGHIGFNVRGSDHFSTTRLTSTNYETQAAAAGDLGGIEVSRKRLVITIGLGTITFNPKCVAIIIAAGEAKAEVVADAIQKPVDILYPATALHKLPNACFYLTSGTAKLLDERQLKILQSCKTLSEEQIEKIVIDISVKQRKQILELTEKDFKNDKLGSHILPAISEDFGKHLNQVRQNLINKIEKGIAVLSGKRFLHTEPHHDDIMLGYLPHVVRHVRRPDNMHWFTCLTSGFTSVTNHFMLEQLNLVECFIDSSEFQQLNEENYFDPQNEIGRNRDIWQYLDGVAAHNLDMKNQGIARRMIRNLITVLEESEFENLKNRIQELKHYFQTQYPGKKDPDYIQKLKGLCREWEAECLWGYLGWDCQYVRHFRLGFYTGNMFTEEPTLERDVSPILEFLEELNPDIVTVAFDPEASGPDTHYKVLQTISEALQAHQKISKRNDLKIWGYRNVWYRFHPSEANMYIPVSLNMFSIMQNAFINSFITQRDASFPSYEHDGPFSELAQKIQVEQYQKIKICLGREWFYEHESPLIRAIRGFVFMKEMDLKEFSKSSRALRKATENK